MKFAREGLPFRYIRGTASEFQFETALVNIALTRIAPRQGTTMEQRKKPHHR
jgi:hypothetical protein